MKMLKYVWYACLILSVAGCEKQDSGSILTDVDYVSYGTSFGECLGYCNNSFLMSGTNITYNNKGYELNVSLPQLTKSVNVDESYWDLLVQKIDFNEFIKSDTIIGCPDCVDGGAEWIEIKKGDKTHKVIFEYKKEPSAVKNYIGLLRTYLSAGYVNTKGTENFNEIVLVDKTAKIKAIASSNGTFQYLVQMKKGNDTIYYFYKYLNDKYLYNNLDVKFNGVLLSDSTTIYKPDKNGIDIPDFKARNINICELTVISD